MHNPEAMGAQYLAVRGSCIDHHHSNAGENCDLCDFGHAGEKVANSTVESNQLAFT